ncbi:AfsR/SARP family transcriptional regulator [Actinoplanes subtropicus]|uniref:AfsR/SARP family transcriptional regulator n=1 Tax=Actinoplanes subtropicus TaxID=543632 RepID=UPI000690A885|nr:BTAD domain-containing putative transcriptional regulator [Actinoplanes subtropicus]
MDFAILGVLEARSAGRRMDIGGMRPTIVLATLLLEAGRVVPLSRLAEAVYGEEPPATGRTQIQNAVSALRKLLGEHGLPEAIETRPPGYLLRIPPDRLDLHRYESEVRAAREAQGPGEAAEHYRAALALWRGPALAGIDSEVVRAAADRLAEHRMAALEECLDVELSLGRHRELVGELTAAVAEHPLRERLRGQLMLALYRSGRQADALEVFRRGRQVLVDELGLEPGEELRRIERDILTGEMPVSRAPANAPRLLPTDISDFTGRADLIDSIERRFAESDPDRGAVPVTVLAGAPGIGKTTLAVHLGHRLAARYPDGQLFADLHGRRVGAEEVLDRFLRALGDPPGTRPEGLDERAERYRDLLAGRRVLVVLDNVADEEQVRPLLPGSARSAVLITSRARLAGLAGAVHAEPGVLGPEQAAVLLARIAGEERAGAEPEATTELAALCGYLPLAMRVAGTRLAARPHWSVRQLVDRLTDEASRLDELHHSGIGVRAGLALAYEQAGPAARRLFRLLGVPDFPDFAGWLAAALLDEPFFAAQDVLDELADAHLVEIDGIGRGVHARYRMHDLIRIFARERLAEEETGEERRAALGRAAGALLHLAIKARRRAGWPVGRRTLPPGVLYPLPDRQADQIVDDPIPWFERERTNLAVTVRLAAGARLTEQCWNLASSAETLYGLESRRADWRAAHETAFAATVRDGDDLGQAVLLLGDGNRSADAGEFDRAIRAYEQASVLFLKLGHTVRAARADVQIGVFLRTTGRLAEAEEVYRRALAVLREAGDQASVGNALLQLGHARLAEGDVAGTRALLAEALETSRRAGSRHVEAQVLRLLGDVHRQEGRWDAAIEAMRQAYDLTKEVKDPIGQAYTLLGIGLVHLRTEDLDAAAEALDEADRLVRGTGDRMAEARVRTAIGELALARQDPATAGEALRAAAAAFRELRAPADEARALGLLDEAAMTRR